MTRRSPDVPVASRQSAGLPMNLAIPGLCRISPGLHLGTTGDNRGVAVALPESVWATVEQRCRPGCSRCRANRCRSFTVTTGSSRRLTF
ncbi:hypothetical protein DPMN_133223 [Dreissena polymorpha]|uniref:Uncharacterized protein n=1 Tax=Dreissena polymorpha TaxID=45954 RepID=A0A9D4FY18_DREPO|nr:hypothetical protein DPMN_133223 [Dreissena polymorpha]